MRYKIEFTNRHACEFADGAHELTDKLERLKKSEVSDIRRITGKFSEESVMDVYGKFVGKKYTRTGNHS